MAEATERQAPGGVFRAVLRRRRLFLVGASLFTIVALLAARHLPLEHSATTEFERWTDAAGKRYPGQESGHSQVVAALRRDLVGREAVQRVAERLGLMRELPRESNGQLAPAGEAAKEQLVRKVQDDLQVRIRTRPQGPDVVSLSFVHEDPRLAGQIPNALVRDYITGLGQRIAAPLTAEREALLKQVKDRDARLAALTDRKTTFEARHGDAVHRDPATTRERIGQIAADLDALRRQHGTVKQTLARLRALRRAQTSATTRPVQVVKGPSPEFKQLQEQLRQSKGQLDAAMTVKHMTTRHPQVITLRAEIAQLEKRLKETPAETVLHTVYGTGVRESSDLGARLAAAGSQLETTTQEIRRLGDRLASERSSLAGVLSIRREYAQIVKQLREERIEAQRRRQRLAGVQAALTAERTKRLTLLNAVQYAPEQLRPSSPSLMAVLAIAVAGGLAVGGGLVFLANAMDHSVATAKEAARHFDIPIHGVIGRIATRRQRIAGKFGRGVLAPAVFVVLLMALAGSVLNVVLWLRFPQEYKQWRDSPIGFVSRMVSGDAAARSGTARGALNVP